MSLRRAHHARSFVLDIGNHDVARHAHLVRMRTVIFELISDTTRGLRGSETSMMVVPCGGRMWPMKACGPAPRPARRRSVEMGQPLNFMGKRGGTLQWSVHFGKSGLSCLKENGAQLTVQAQAILCGLSLIARRLVNFVAAVTATPNMNESVSLATLFTAAFSPPRCCRAAPRRCCSAC